MDNVKTGRLIRRLRKEKGYTQLQLAEMMNISDKTISKWERGQGGPELSLLSDLSEIFSVDMEKLLTGELNTNKTIAGNMKKINFYICPECGNILTSLADATISCCGKKLKAAVLKKADTGEKLSVEITDNHYYITGSHPMTKDHYISFVVFLTSDSVIIRKLYPQWDLQTRIPYFAHGRLVWYCTEHGLFYQDM